MSSSSSSIVKQVLVNSPLRELPPAAQAASLAVIIPVLAVVLNVLSQLLLPKDRSKPPMVFHWFPIIGSAVTYGMDPIKFFRDCRDKHGDVFTFVLLGRNVTVALGAKGSNLVLNGKLSQVSAEEAYTHLTTPVFGKEVVFDVPNHVLMEQKRFVKVGLSTENFRAYVPQITDEVTQFVKTDPAFEGLKTSKSHTVNIFKAMCEITILTASRTLQGKEVRESLDKTFADLYHDLDSGFTPINFVIPNLPLPNNFKRDRAQKKMADFYRSIIERRRKEGTEADHTDMIAAVMQQSYKDGRKVSDTEVAHMMIALLMAGQHTSSATGTWAMLRLASRPEIIQEVYEEQVKVYGDGAGGFREMDYDTQKSSVPVLDAVVKETLRLHPPIHSIMRKVKSPIPVPASYAAPRGKANENRTYVIPEGHYVLASPTYNAHDPNVWKEAEVFNPHRWFDKEGVVMQSGDDEKADYGFGVISTGANSPYLPFGAGRHRCIGEQFAYLQLGTIIANFVRAFDWKLATVFPDPDYQSMVVLPKADSNIVFTKRS